MQKQIWECTDCGDTFGAYCQPVNGRCPMCFGGRILPLRPTQEDMDYNGVTQQLKQEER